MIRFLSILLCSTAFLTAAESKPLQTGLPPQHNFLFVVDTSGSMAAQKVLAANLVRWGIYSGFDGQAQEGDSIDIWTYDDENHITRYPPQIVGREDAEQMALAAGRFVEGLKFRGRSLFPPVATDLNLLMPHTKGLLVMIITDGDEPITGVSVDIEVNEHIAREKKEHPNARGPYLISLAIVNGKIAQWAVHHGDEKLQLATLPERPKPAPVIATIQKSAKPKKEPAPEPPVVIELPPGARVAASFPPAADLGPDSDGSPITSLESALDLHGRAEEAIVPVQKTAIKPAGREEKSVVVAKVSTEPAAKTPEKPAPAPQHPVNPLQSAQPERKVAVAVAPTTATVQPKDNFVQSSKSTNASKSDLSTNTPVAAGVKPQTPTPPKVENPTSSPSLVAEAAPSSAFGMPSIPAGTIYLALFAGLVSIALGVVMLLRKSKARHTGSIISRSLQQ